MTRFTPQWLQAEDYAASVDRRLIGALWPTPASSGCAVTATGAMDLHIAPGQVAVPTSNNTGSLLCTSDGIETVTLDPAPPATTDRIDLVVCRAHGTDVDGGANNDFLYTFVKGAPAATPTVPATPQNAVVLAQVYLVGGSAAVDPARITDVRPWGLSVNSDFGSWPPNTSSGGNGVRVDSSGEVWVSKGGVNGGAWKRARDVLHASVWRAGAWSIGANNMINFDSVAYDPYAWYGINWGFVPPVRGIYLCSGAYNVGNVGGTTDINIASDGVSLGYGAGFQLTPSGWAHPHVSRAVMLEANSRVTINATASTAQSAVPGADQTWATFHYLGTGI